MSIDGQGSAATLAFVAPIPLFLALRAVERPFHAILLGFGWGAAFFGLLLLRALTRLVRG
mgnify:CR=1 FL=1